MTMADTNPKPKDVREELMIELLTEYQRHAGNADAYLSEATADPAAEVDQDDDDDAGYGSHLTPAQAHAAADTHAQLAQAAAVALAAIVQLDVAKRAAAPAALAG
jgi:hypothetical protein